MGGVRLQESNHRESLSRRGLDISTVWKLIDRSTVFSTFDLDHYDVTMTYFVTKKGVVAPHTLSKKNYNFDFMQLSCVFTPVPIHSFFSRFKYP